MRRILLFCACLLLTRTAGAQQIRPVTSGQLYNEISRLQNLVTVLYVAAHPDDENTRLLAWLANDRHVRTAYLSLTRGDGGQNIIGPEQGAALGLIRTNELLEARKLDGAEQYFTRAIDFGFSKTYTETFRHWDEEALTADVVWIYRKLRPDVLICRFPPNELAGHGQHAASAILARQAYDASGDASRYPDQLRTFPAWKPKRLLWNTFRFGDRNTTADTQLKIAVGHYAPLIGMGYGELAGISRSIHRSQGAGTPSVAGIQPEFFMTVAGDKPTGSLFDGIDTTWNRVGAPEIGTAIGAVLDDFDFNHPDRSIPALLRIRERIAAVKDTFWRAQKEEEINTVLLHCAGFQGEALTPAATAVKGAPLPVTVRLLARSATPVRVVHGGRTWNLRDTFSAWTDTVVLSRNAPLTEPYWLSAPASGALFPGTRPEWTGLPMTPPWTVVPVQVRIGDALIPVSLPVSFKRLDPLRGDVIEAIRVVPKITVAFASPLLVADADGAAATTVRLHAEAGDTAAVVLRLQGKELYRSALRLRPGMDTLLPVRVLLPAAVRTSAEPLFLTASAEGSDNSYNQTQQLISYPHLPTLQYFTPASARVLPRNWNVTAKRVGYIEGAGDFTDDFLRLSGLQVDALQQGDLSDARNLRTYDAIVVGIRALNVEKRMPQWMPVLLQYVKAGGTVVVQYNTLQDLTTPAFAPYPVSLSAKRVTEENAAVTVLDSANALLRRPNVIRPADWADWVQERSLYVPTQWDAHYTAPLRMADAGEAPLDGALLQTGYGKGQFIYTGLSFFRQLPAGNTGAVRLLMNLVSAGKGATPGRAH